ncbi:Dynamin-1-like protein, partial [Perkinsus chesapeaki]
FSDFSEIRREIQEDTERVCGASKGVSPEPICLKIFSPYVIDLTLIDLPGITKVPVGDQPLDVEARIKEMVLSYISKPNCIILAVTAANTDLANSDSLQLARQVDPSGDRTMGVITKMDCMDEGTDALDMISGKVYPLRQGYVGVVCRSQKDIQNGVTIRDSIKNEEAFFKKHDAYRHIASHCGTAYMARQLHRILMAHIRDALPGLRDRVTAMLHEQEIELMNYGTYIGGEALDRTQAGNLILQLFTKFSRCFADCIEGRNNANRNDFADGSSAPSAIVGGARIHYIFFDVFGTAVNQFDPFDGLTDHDIRTSIRNANGPKSPLFVPEAAFETLVKGQISKLLSPSIQCAELVHAELTKCLNVTIRFDKLRSRVHDVVRSVLASCLAPTKEMIGNLIKIETGYINTNHPDFIGGSRAISACTMAYSTDSPHYSTMEASAAFHFPKGEPPTAMSTMDPTPSLSECGSTAPDGGQQMGMSLGDPPEVGGAGGTAAVRSGIFGFWRASSNANSGGSSTLRREFSRHSDTDAQPSATSAVPSPMSPRVNGGSHISIAGLASANPPQCSGGLLWSLGPLRNTTASPMIGLERDNSISSLTGGLPSGIRLAAPPAIVSVHSSQLTEKERIETDIIKSLIASYLNIVKRSICDLVPKAVMCFMVNTFGADMVLHRELVTQLYKEDLFSELLNEAPEIAQGRAQCTEAIRVLRQAAEVINQITNFNVSTAAVANSPRDHDNTISRKQCEFIVAAPIGAAVRPSIHVKDVSRYNTTYLNGSDITSSNRTMELASGDAVKIGSASEGFRVLDVPLLVDCAAESDNAKCEAAGFQTVDSVEAADLLLLPGEAEASDPMVLSAVVLGKPIASSAALGILVNGGKCLNLTTVAWGTDWSSDPGKTIPSLVHLESSSTSNVEALSKGVCRAAGTSPEACRCLDQSLRFTSACLTAEPLRSTESTVYVDGEKPSSVIIGSLSGAAYYTSTGDVIACILSGHSEGRFGLIGPEGSAERLCRQDDREEVDSAQLRPRVCLKPLERPIVEEDTDMSASPVRTVASEKARAPDPSPKRSLLQTPGTRRRAMTHSPLGDSQTRALSGSGGWHCKRPRLQNEATAEYPEEGSVPIPVGQFTRRLQPDEHAKEACVPPEEVNYKAFRRRGSQAQAAPVKMPPIQLVTFTPDLADGYGNAEEDLRLFDEVPGLRQRYIARRR